MTVNILTAARHMAKRSGWSLSNLQLQKLIYLAHMFQLGRTGELLVDGSFEAGYYGPVHPQLYHSAKVFGSSPVRDVFGPRRDISGTLEGDILDETYDALGDTRPGQLVNATHMAGGAWDINYIPGERRRIIPNKDILKEYVDMDHDE